MQVLPWNWLVIFLCVSIFQLAGLNAQMLLADAIY